MAIEVLLRRSIEGVGSVGEVVRVRNGYARNYLLPRGYAALVSAEAMKWVDKDKAAEAVREAQLAKERAAVADRLAATTVTVEARAGEDGHLYGSVGTRQVVDALKKLKFDFEDRHVHLEPVKELGEYEVQVRLGRDQTVPVKLWVVQDAKEAVILAEEKAKAAAAAGASGEAPPAAAAAPAPGKAGEERPAAKASAAPKAKEPKEPKAEKKEPKAEKAEKPEKGEKPAKKAAPEKPAPAEAASSKAKSKK